MKHTVLLLVLLSGCAVKEYDPVTRAQIARTIEFERQNYRMYMDAIEDGIMDQIERESLIVRHDSEIERLEAWLAAEAAKEVK